MLFNAIDDHAHLAFTAMHPDETKGQATAFLRNAVAYYAKLGESVKRLVVDDGAPFRPKLFAETCAELGVKHRFKRAYRPPNRRHAVILQTWTVRT